MGSLVTFFSFVKGRKLFLYIFWLEAIKYIHDEVLFFSWVVLVFNICTHTIMALEGKNMDRGSESCAYTLYTLHIHCKDMFLLRILCSKN